MGSYVPTYQFANRSSYRSRERLHIARVGCRIAKHVWFLRSGRRPVCKQWIWPFTHDDPFANRYGHRVCIPVCKPLVMCKRPITSFSALGPSLLNVNETRLFISLCFYSHHVFRYNIIITRLCPQKTSKPTIISIDRIWTLLFLAQRRELRICLWLGLAYVFHLTCVMPIPDKTFRQVTFGR